VFECVGIPGMLDTSVAAAAVHGTVVVVGLCMQADPFVPVAALVKEIAMQFVVYYTRPEFGHVIDTLARGQLPAGEFVTGHVDLAGINRAFTDLATAPEHRKILVTP
jgi:(R,R)-butanediol dehydrogenase/meso-butanediol dehydrogenase/diacetyl reductase